MLVRGLIAALVLVGCGRIGFDPVPPDAPFEEPPDFTTGTRLRPNVLVGDDGSVLFSGWYDSVLDSDCYFTEIDGELRCFPTQRVLAEYSDSACTQPYVGILPSCLRTSKTVLATLGAGDPDKLYRVGPAEMLPMAYVLSGGSCVVQTATPVQASPLIQQLQSSDFVGARERIVPHGRLSYVMQTADDGTEQKTPELYDTVRGEKCTWVPFGPGEARCIPAHQSGGPYYVDAGCTQPAVVTSIPPSVSLVSSFACDATPSVHSVGNPLAALYYLDMMGQCTSVVIPSGQMAFPVGAEISADVFPTATLAPFAATPRVQIARWQGPDGVTLPTGVWDTAKPAPCTILPVHGASNLESCAPNPIVPYSGFSDAGCSMFIGSVAQSCDTWIAKTDVPGTRTCAGFTYDLYLYETPVPPPTYSLNPTCTGFSVERPVYSESPTPLDPLSLVSFGFATQ